MSGSCEGFNRKSRSIGPSLRIKMKDYTIPVRLNQQQQSLSKLEKRSGKGDLIYRAFVRMLKMISINKSKRFVTINSSLITISMLLTIISFNSCQCDTQTISIDKSTTSKLKNAPSEIAASASHKERLLSMLHEDIERQHFKMKPINSFVQKRPSKFDSGDDYAISASNFMPKFTNSSTKQQTVSNLKADESLRSILRMHENVYKPLATPVIKVNEDVSTEPTTMLSKTNWLPSRVVQKLSNSNRVVSQVLSLVSPLVGNKLKETSLLNRRKSFNNTHKFNLHQFVGRSNSETNSIASGLSINNKPEQSFSSLATPSPQTLFLVKPDSWKELTNDKYYSTRPSTLFADYISSNRKKVIDTNNDLDADSSSNNINVAKQDDSKRQTSNLWLKNRLVNSHLQDSVRDIFTQLPILSSLPISTAPSVLERNVNSKSKVTTANKSNAQTPNTTGKALEDLYRYAYMIGASLSRKKDLPVLSNFSASNKKGSLRQRSIDALSGTMNRKQFLDYEKRLRSLLSDLTSLNKARPRGVMWDMATDPSLAVTVFHLMERATVALPLGFLLMPLVHMIRNPLNGIHFNRMFPAVASHRSVDYEELAKRLDVVDKILSRALRSTHRESFIG